MYVFENRQKVNVIDFWYAAMMMEAAGACATSVNFYNIPADSHLHSRRREKLKSHTRRVQIRKRIVPLPYM
jgi:hypothetical protein